MGFKWDSIYMGLPLSQEKIPVGTSWDSQLVLTIPNWSMLFPTGLSYSQLVYAIPNWSLLFPTGLCNSQLVYAIPNWSELGKPVGNINTNWDLTIPNWSDQSQLV